MSTTTVRPTRMTSGAKTWLSKSIRDIRERLLKDLADELQSVYRLSLPESRADLSSERAAKRGRFESYLDEQARAGNRGAGESLAEARERHKQAAIKLAGATLVNRLVVLRSMEALGQVRTRVVTGGWSSPGYRELREAGPALAGDADEGYSLLLRLVSEELALDLPGLFGEVGVNALIPIPTATLRWVVETLEGADLDEPDRVSLWGDDTLLGWVYQFWNDPERESLDEKIRTGGKIENHEIAAKTQLFTDRYIVEWLLQNSLGQLWFAMCAKHEKQGWAVEAYENGTIDALDRQRKEWREKRRSELVSLEALMPCQDEQLRWRYWVPRDLPKGSELSVPDSLRGLRILDPACGSGHYLVIAFDLLTAFYEEEARHRGTSEQWTKKNIAEWIIEDNLFGVDLDPRAVQIAAAALWLKMKCYSNEASPARFNLVAANLGLGSVSPSDPSLTELKDRLALETGLLPEFTDQLVQQLMGCDQWGSLLRLRDAVRTALNTRHSNVGHTNDSIFHSASMERSIDREGNSSHGSVWAPKSSAERDTVQELLAEFAGRHTSSDDLGIRLRAEQIAAGTRFIQILSDKTYHLIIGNPPYQGSSKLADSSFLTRNYPLGKEDLCTAFILRSIELLRPGGLCFLLTIRGWLFTGQFKKFRAKIWSDFALDLVGDFDQGAFSNETGNLLSVVALLMRKSGTSSSAVAVLPTPFETRWRNDNRRAFRKEAALLCCEGRHDFVHERLNVIPGHPLIYWWNETFLERYAGTPKLGEAAQARKGLCTGDDGRFNRAWWEVRIASIFLDRRIDKNVEDLMWAPTIKGAKELVWIEPLREIVRFFHKGLELRAYEYTSRGVRFQNEPYYFQLGVAFSMISSSFTARAHRYRSIFGNKGSSVFPDDIPQTVCLMNSALARQVMESLNPGVGFEVGDVNRLPLFPVKAADRIYAQLDQAFTQHEQARETSVEFRRPGPSSWRTAQEWAQRAVDRPAGTPLPPYEPTHDPERLIDQLSFALGVALGRFGPDGEGILDRAPGTALPHGILFLSSAGGSDSLEHPATRPLHEAWQQHGKKIAPKTPELRDYLRTKLFPDDHLKRYEKRPIYFPLSSEKRSFVAWCSIHRWTDSTLQVLLADFLQPEAGRIKAELADLAEARTTGDRTAQARAQGRFTEVQALYEEMLAFIRAVQEIAERGAPPTGPKCPPREADARFKMDLDDGVMINSAALWPLLQPQWKDPANWWADLCTAKGKGYDWAHLAKRYFPIRVDQKCQKDPSLAVAQGCFWKYHLEKAYQWELRLQAPDELGPDFRLDEPGSDAYRAEFEQRHSTKVRELREGEEKRRARKAEKAEEEELELDFDEEGEE